MRGVKQLKEYDGNSTVYRRLFLCRYLDVRGRKGLSRERANGRPRDDRYKTHR